MNPTAIVAHHWVKNPMHGFERVLLDNSSHRSLSHRSLDPHLQNHIGCKRFFVV